MEVGASANPAFYPLAVAGETERGIRTYAIRQAYWSLVAEKVRAGSARRHFSEVLWLTASHIHFDDEEIFGIWVVCSLSRCGNGLMDAAEHYFHKQIERMTIEELAGLVALVKSPSLFAPGTDRGEQRKQMILEKYRAGS
jgi:membrane carboxypeptidase/penicillin-binding protein